MGLYVKSRRLDSNLNMTTQHECVCVCYTCGVLWCVCGGGVCVLVSRSDLSLRKITLAMAMRRRDEDVP